MKKIIFIMLAVFATAYAQAQTTTPRYGYSSSRDRTMRTLTMDYAAITDAAGFDSVTIAPKYHHTQYKVTLTASDSLRFASPTVTNCYFGDKITIIAAAGAGTSKMTFSWYQNTKWRTTSPFVSITSGHYAILNFVFNGSVWVEESRSISVTYP